MATIGGARALGLDASVGSLEQGKQADLVLFAEAGPSLSNVHDPYQELVYCASPRDVHTVWVGGRPVVSGGRALGVDLPALLPRARELAVKLAVDAGLDSELARGTSG
jgi:cytosine/adenosine deaminase-related metal-dependent hydrolase